MSKKKKQHQFVLSPIECRLFRHLRKLETEFDADNNILESTEPKLDKRLKLTFELDNHPIGSFNIAGSRLVEECASASIHVVQTLMNLDEHAANHGSPLATDNAPATLNDKHLNECTPVVMKDAKEAETPRVDVAAKPLSWDDVKQDLLPPYVKVVGFFVAQHDRNPELHADLSDRFPDVQIFYNQVPGCQDVGPGLRAATGSRELGVRTPEVPIISSTKAASSPSVGTCSSTTSEATPATSKITSSRTSVAPSGIASGHTETFDESTDFKKHRFPPLWVIAERISLSLTESSEIQGMWTHWHSHHKVRPFTPLHGRSLDQFYQDLVTLYILAFHNKQEDLCFAILLMFQYTNYKYKNKMPDLATAILTFQHLPENNDLCRWISILFAFLWNTQEYQTRGNFLATFPQIDKDAFATFMFAIAHIRDPFTKGHNTAVLDQWCNVHHHNKGDGEETLCKEMYSKMETKFEEIKAKEAEDEYHEAKKLVKEHEKTMPIQAPKKDSAPLKEKKRKAESSAVSPHKKHKKTRGGLNQED